jgi:uncharacterized protein YmfQ (DUF2313 family)
MTTLDPVRSSTDVTLSNGNLTAVKTANESMNSWAVSVPSGGTQLYAEVRFNGSVMPRSCGFGIANAGEVNPIYVGGTTNSLANYSDSTIYLDENSLGNGAPFSTGDTVAIAVSTVDHTVQFRNITLNTPWSRLVRIDALGVTGYIYLALNLHHINDSWTVNFAGPFLDVPPMDFGRWDGTEIFQPRVARLDASEAPDIATFAGQLALRATLTASEAPDVASIKAFIPGVSILEPVVRTPGFYIFGPGEDRHLRHSGSDYANQFLTLLPQGQAWPKSPGTTLYQTCVGLSNYWGFVDGRAGDLLERESDPRVTTELLPDWERAWGLPDPCFPGALTVEERRKMLIFVYTLKGFQSRSWFIQVMYWLGYTVTIKEFAPFMAGVSRVGDTRPTPPDNYRWYIGPPELRFYWSVEAQMPKLIWFRASSGQSGIDHHLEIRVPEELLCLLERWKPAQTKIVYDMSGLATGGPMQGTP